MATWTLTWEMLLEFAALVGLTKKNDLSELVSQLHINNNDKTYPTIPPIGTGALLMNLAKHFPALVGGLKIASVVQSLDTDGVDYTATQSGVITTVPALDLAYSLINALGVTIETTTDVIKEKVLSALSTVYGETVTALNAACHKVIGLLYGDGSFYVTEDIVKSFSDALYAEDFFSVRSTSKFLDVGESFSWTPLDDDFSLSMLQDFISIARGYTEIQVPATIDLSGIMSDFTSRLYNPDDLRNVCRLEFANMDGYWLLSIGLKYNTSAVLLERGGPVNTDEKGNQYQAIIGAGGATDVRSFKYYVYPNTWTFYQISTGSGANIGSKFTAGARPNYVFYYFNRQSEPVIDGIDIQVGATLPSANIDVQNEYPTWTGTAIDIGLWDRASEAIRKGKAFPIDLQDDGSTTYDTPQAIAQSGTVTRDTTKKKIIDGVISVIDVPTDWVDVNTLSIPLDIPTSPEPMNTDTPPVVLPTGTAGGPVTVYNPTQAQMDSLRTELWNNGLVTSVQALFNANPMDAIISCHMIYASPHVSATKKGLYLGNVSMNISGVNVVDEQFIEVDCGTVSVPELFGNATDYEPYTSVEIYLPFIGIQQLSANDIVGGSVSLVMKEDVLTGAILAEVTVTKNGSTQILYQFTGNGAVQIPLTGQDRLSQIMGGIKGALSGGFTGGVAGALIGAASGAIASKPSIMKSGGFSPNTGAMAGKLPYLIINRNVPLDASEYNKFSGYPSNKKVNLGSVSGFTRVKDVHVEGIICTEQEKTLIEEALKEGIFL